MASSDSDYYESADEENESISNINKPKKKLTKVGETSSKNTQAPKVPINEGWDDFDIDDDVKIVPKTSRKEPKVGDSSLENTLVPQSGWDDFGDWEQQDSNVQVSNHKNALHQSVKEEDDKMKSITDKLANINVKEQTGSTNWGWSSWGVGSILDSASVGFNTISNHVSQGISSVTSAIESSIGAPDPEELARRNNIATNMNKVEPDFNKNTPTSSGKLDEQSGGDVTFGFNSLLSGVSHITKFVESTGTKVISGGLDTLETIGKKTMEVLQENDPGLAKKRALLGLNSGEKIVLSQILREAKERGEEEDRAREEKREAKEVHYETLFDDCEGLVHLEALEMLSRQVSMQIESKLQTADVKRRQELKETLQQVSELCECSDSDIEEDDSVEADETEDKVTRFQQRLESATSECGIKFQFEHIIKRNQEMQLWFESLQPDTEPKAIYKRAISELAANTALCVQIYLKSAQLLMVKSRRSTADEADSLTQLTTILSRHLSDIATDFTDTLNKQSNETNTQLINQYITNIFLESGNSSTYIQNAFQLILPILQIGAV